MPKICYTQMPVFLPIFGCFTLKKYKYSKFLCFIPNLVDKILNSENFTFSFVTFDTVELYECTIPKNNGMNQSNLLY